MYDPILGAHDISIEFFVKNQYVILGARYESYPVLNSICYFRIEMKSRKVDNRYEDKEVHSVEIKIHMYLYLHSTFKFRQLPAQTKYMEAILAMDWLNCRTR